MAVIAARRLLAEASARLASQGALRIVLLSDLGFEFGAGTAMRRQAQSLLLDGHDVGVVCCGRMHEGRIISAIDPGRDALRPRAATLRGAWLGMRSVPEAACIDPRMPRTSDPRVIDGVAAFAPDLVVVGNLHWAGWSVSLLEKLVGRGIACAAYMHDLHFLTGRCAQPYACGRFRSGCDAQCPTADRYPILAPARIAEEWMLRRHIFVECGIPLVANSCWSRQSALDALGTEVSVDVVPLGVDTDCFAPMPRDVARAALGLERSLDDSVPLVVFGSVDTALPEKGGPVLRRVMNLMRHDGVRFACFGHRSEAFDRAIPLGFIADERMMPIVYGAADCYVTLSAVESFGQTALEAAACGRPIVALRGGGIVEVAVDGVNAITVHDAEPDAVAWAIRTVLSDSTRASAMGLAGRALAKSRYSLATQASSWRAWIGGWSAPPVLDEAVVRDSSNPPEGVSSAKGGAR